MTNPALTSVILLFGASGDLATRMLWPSLHHLFVENLLPSGLKIIGSGRMPQSSATFRAELKSLLKTFGHNAIQTEENIDAFVQHVEYVTIDINDANAFDALKALVPDNAELLCYLSTSPALYTTICRHLHKANLVKSTTRLILEKPIGHDLKTSLEISDAVG